MARWPSSLPQSFLIGSIQIRRQKQAIHSPTDVGPGISRRRSSAYSEFFTGAMIMTQAQYNTLVAFYDDTLHGGTLPFDWVHPLTGAAVSMKFDLQAEHDILISEIIKTDKWRVELAFEILP